MKTPDHFVRFTTGVLIGVLAAGMFFSAPDRPGQLWAGADRPTVDSIRVIPLQIGREAQGIIMVDTQTRTLWVYEILNRRTGLEQIRLLAARTWEYDRQLTEWNCADPTPSQIRTVLQGVQQQQMIESILPPEAEETERQKTKTDTTQ